MARCNTCGTNNVASAIYCDECGTRLTPPTPVVVPAAPETPPGPSLPAWPAPAKPRPAPLFSPLPPPKQTSRRGLFAVIAAVPIALFGLAKFGPNSIQQRLFGPVGGVVGDWPDEQVEGYVALCTLGLGDQETCECVANRVQASISSDELIEAFTARDTPPWYTAALDNAVEACT
jgi:hypothetical protein